MFVLGQIALFINYFPALQTTGALVHPQMLPVVGVSVPNVPIGQSVSMSSMPGGQSGGGPVAQTYLQPSTMVPQVSQSVPQHVFQVKMVMELICITFYSIFTLKLQHVILLSMEVKLWYFFITFGLIRGLSTNHPLNTLRLTVWLYVVQVFPQEVS